MPYYILASVGGFIIGYAVRSWIIEIDKAITRDQAQEELNRSIQVWWDKEVERVPTAQY